MASLIFRKRFILMILACLGYASINNTAMAEVTVADCTAEKHQIITEMFHSIPTDKWQCVIEARNVGTAVEEQCYSGFAYHGYIEFSFENCFLPERRRYNAPRIGVDYEVTMFERDWIVKNARFDGVVCFQAQSESQNNLLMLEYCNSDPRFRSEDREKEFEFQPRDFRLTLFRGGNFY